ncbi:ribosomal RNA small subunit methyltransferase A [Candidatus Nomurabacteria bacterium RIFCSPLOWO2_01_FULL_36_10b]|uniref:Ribosomal RNA small subunit methyltransferase A n=1 Tax=Candidatus Nomurabacteria bacterium RIFCSPLOWO2_01_FULL_36_10b TaxID=1801766 RepID=A0A1F6WPZ0_9BACT|nr:MAG: ribosomal RNA small subunit methyltransferase A [Candidatus Nomurabacteria bacterium RIFCSPLOWO2_01_FULL_36_10b]
MAKKSLGQHFLKQHSYIRKIIDVADITADEITLEIGPGKGALTEKLLVFGSKVIAVETDKDLIAFLRHKFYDACASNILNLVEDNILNFDETVLKNYDMPYRVVANIPYYITGAILEKFLSSQYQPTSMTLVIQKEVADRIMMRGGKGSILAISVQAYGIPHSFGKIPARYFSPEPKVDSAILRIDNISRNNFKKCNEEHFFAIVKEGFAHKRKKLLSNLELKFPHVAWMNIFSKLGISEMSRAEELSCDMWIALAIESQHVV